MRKIFLLVLILFGSLVYIKSQNVELAEVWVKGFPKQKEIFGPYEPYTIAFVFRVNNNTKDTLSIGAYHLPGEDMKFGYFEIIMKTGEIFKLKSKRKLVCLLPNDSISFLADLCDFCEDCGDCVYLRQFNSYLAIRDCIVNSEIYYSRIEKDYEYVDDCNNGKIASQKVTMNKYLILITWGGDEIIHYYYIGDIVKDNEPESKCCYPKNDSLILE